MLLRMWPSRKKVLVGLSVATVALEMITDPPLFVAMPLFGVGAFLLIWGLWPQQLLHGVRKIPGHDILTGWMVKFDDWFEGAPYDANVASKLHALHARWHEMKRVEDPAALRQAVSRWTQEVTSYLDEHLPDEAYMFLTIAPNDAQPRSALEKRVEKLRLIIGRYEKLQWRGGRE